ncbi:MAG: hypothetical protein Q8R63_00570, partial [Ramlibacter sp.]|nr:hypothetical protein [Ramlibacter sp.]
MAVFERPDRDDRRAAKHQQRLERVRSALSQLAEPGKSLAHWIRCTLALVHAKPWKFIRDEERFVAFERLVAEAAEAATEPEIRLIMSNLRSVRAH